MSIARDVRVSLTPALIDSGAMAGRVAVVVDVLRATTTMLTALAAGAKSIVTCSSIDEAKAAAADPRWSPALLAGERGGKPIAGFDLGNSPGEFTAKQVKDKTVILTTTNGTPALLSCHEAARTIIGAFINFSAVCEHLDAESHPIHIVCAGTKGQPTLEDTLFAGALVDHLSETADVTLDDSARLAWDCFENHGRILPAALEISAGGEALLKLGYDADLKAAAAIDKLALVAEVEYEPTRVHIASAGIKRKHWPHDTW